MELQHDSIFDFFDNATTSSTEVPSLWVFGYGSLMWNPSMQFTQVVRASLTGYTRLFSLANMTYRGTPKMPGRVVTLVPDPAATTHGLAFKLEGRTAILAAIEHLFSREVANGYSFQRVILENIDVGAHERQSNLTLITAVTVIADPKCPLFVGRSEPLMDTALQIALAHGSAGPNVDYLLKLASNMRRYFPYVYDRYLFSLEQLVLDVMQTVMEP